MFEMRVETRRQDQPDVDRFAEHREPVERARSVRLSSMSIHAVSSNETTSEGVLSAASSNGMVVSRRALRPVGAPGRSRVPAWRISIAGVIVELSFAIAQIVGIDIVV
jgi:hypothetical protein